MLKPFTTSPPAPRARTSIRVSTRTSNSMPCRLSETLLAGAAAQVHLVFDGDDWRTRIVPRDSVLPRAAQAGQNLGRQQRIEVVNRVNVSYGNVAPTRAEAVHTPFHQVQYEARLGC